MEEKEARNMFYIILLLLVITIGNVVLTNYRISQIEDVVTQQQETDTKRTAVLNDAIITIRALDNKIDDIQIQRYYSWIEAKNISQKDLAGIPTCLFDIFGRDLEVGLVGDSMVKFVLDKQYTLNYYANTSHQCVDVIKEELLDCEKVCEIEIAKKTPTNSTKIAEASV
jgi:hypothetical protein